MTANSTARFNPGAVLVAVNLAARRLWRWPSAKVDRVCDSARTGNQVGAKKRSSSVEQRN